MARIRTIKPEFFEDEGLAKLPPHDRLMFIGTWLLADKNGVLEYRPDWIKAKIFPYEHGETTDVSLVLPRLVSGRYLVHYEVDGKEYLAVRNFGKHQRITGKEAEGVGRYPLPINELSDGKHPGNIQEASGKHPGAQEQGAGNMEQGRGGGGEVEPTSQPPDPMAQIQAANQITSEVDRRRTWRDWQIAIGHRIFVGRDEADAWAALYAAEGWDEMTKAYEYLDKKHKKPGKIYLSMFQELR